MKSFLGNIHVVFNVVFLISCEILPQVSYSSWSRFPEGRETSNTAALKKNICIYLEDPQVDKPLATRSVQEELERLARFFLMQVGYEVVQSETEADYRLEIVAVEREFTQGWYLRRSISIEASLWCCRADTLLFDYSLPGDKKKSVGTSPVAVGRAVVVGQKSLSSSVDLENLLRKALTPVLNRGGA